MVCTRSDNRGLQNRTDEGNTINGDTLQLERRIERVTFCAILYGPQKRTGVSHSPQLERAKRCRPCCSLHRTLVTTGDLQTISEVTKKRNICSRTNLLGHTGLVPLICDLTLRSRSVHKGWTYQTDWNGVTGSLSYRRAVSIRRLFNHNATYISWENTEHL